MTMKIFSTLFLVLLLCRCVSAQQLSFFKIEQTGNAACALVPTTDAGSYAGKFSSTDLFGNPYRSCVVTISKDEFAKKFSFCALSGVTAYFKDGANVFDGCRFFQNKTDNSFTFSSGGSVECSFVCGDLH